MARSSTANQITANKIPRQNGIHPRAKMSKKNDQSHANRTFQNKGHVNKINESEKTTSGQSEISTAKISSNLKEEDIEKMNRENLYHWVATREIMEIKIRRNKNPDQ